MDIQSNLHKRATFLKAKVVGCYKQVAFLFSQKIGDGESYEHYGNDLILAVGQFVKVSVLCRDNMYSEIDW